MRAFVIAVAITLFTAAAAFAGGSSDIAPEAVLAEMNRQRAAHGLGPLTLESRLSAAAMNRMTDMEELSYWAHVSPDGRSPFTWLGANGYRHSYAGENLASGFETVRLMVEAWMESPGHRANILSPMYTECGVAIIDGSTRGPATGKSVVVLYARQQSVPQRAAK